MTGRVLVAGCLAACAVGTAVADARPLAGKDGAGAMEFVENGLIRVGVALEWGGAITHVSVPGGPNLINFHDLGREIQQSYYSGPANYQREGKQKSPAWAAFPWNPIQTGDAYHNGSEVLEHRAGNGGLYVKTIPKLWPMNNDAGECVMETWIQLLPGAARFSYHARLTNQRSDKTPYRGHHQEVPAVYVNGPWCRLMAYTGDRPFTGDAVREIRNDHKEAWPWVNFLPTEAWAAWVREDGTGIGVCVPRPMEFNGGFSGKRGQGGEKDASTGYVAPMTTEILDSNIVYEYSCLFVVGKLEDIRSAAKRLAPKEPPSWNFDHARHGWSYENGHDAGWPLAGRGLVVRADRASQPVRLIGPCTFWRAENASHLRLRVSAKAAGTVRVYWRGVPPDGAATAPSQWAAWRRGWFDPTRSTEVRITAGTREWATVQLAGLPTYQGGLTGLGLDVPDGVAVHDVSLGDEAR